MMALLKAKIGSSSFNRCSGIFFMSVSSPIFRLVYHKAGCRKPFERLWISSMEDVAIKESFENLRSGTEYDALYEAALCRERAD